MSWCSDSPEDQAICLFAGLLANPDVPLSLYMFDNQFRIIYTYSHVGIHEYMNSYKHLQSCFTRTQFLL